MVKSPLEYFETQDFDTVSAVGGPPTSAEAAFMKKYLGMNGPHVLADLVLLQEPASLPLPRTTGDGSPAASSVAEPVREPEIPASAETALRQEEQVQFVGFTLGGQLYTIPTVLVQEVIRSLPLCRLPAMASCVSGAISLRGRVMPVIRLREVLDAELPADGAADAFTIVCRCREKEVGVLIDRVHSIYRIARQDIQWDAAARLGLGEDCIAGLFRLNEQLVPIVSMEHVVKIILRK